ncbi:MAG: twin-arginine translocase TatA/TatE family subunit [bacterium]|nr:twin-arginine translocase TatA/TatE family subunit [bacterium]
MLTFTLALGSWSSGLLNSACLGFLSGIGYTEMVLLGVIALMLFGSKLPEVARNFGATYRQLRGKVDEFQREFREWERMDYGSQRPKLPADDEERSEPKSPKFVPPPPEDDE